ncbi:MAG: 30S ribosomal protein S9 [Nitrospira sp.]|nr:30S ribosomal protein S9 [Nitrospira sp.]MDR4487899.1 30S ribosomal protein S9 [Nitrospirales bacterium]MCA9464560.1 30S ribosomal protein S9 [Nitrospira sp.]MCA9477049.1 30S ribosomal protein S9 [Nitrospira sp.]MCA9480078.1 30S ribosomal protein S9 [Nitrospira sp.]
MAQTNQYATGKRKYAVARAWIEPGQGTIQVNGRPLANYFPRMTHQLQVQTPFDITKTMGQFNVQASLTGGGISGQAGALRHAIAKALSVYNPSLRTPLKKLGLLTRDSRVKERKKYGQKGARRRFQYSKR